jgi:hypothetical protein
MVNPYDSSQTADKPLTAELKPRPLLDRILLVGVPLCAGGGIVTAWHSWIQDQLVMFASFGLLGIAMTWFAWRRSK